MLLSPQRHTSPDRDRLLRNSAQVRLAHGECHGFAARFCAALGFIFLFTYGAAIHVNAEEIPWSLRPIVQPTPPAPGHPIDAFIRAKLTAEKIAPSPPAEPLALLRRLSLDLTGLPPTRDEIAAFLEGGSDVDAAMERLLASPHYGERWGRHWLDVARYVQGTIKVPGVPAIDLAEPYRDYVVRSFNEDKPYDRFLTEQLAGDLLTAGNESEQARQDRVIAPAFLSIGQWFDECTDPEQLRLDIVDEQISTATRAFLAMDFSCARCHDHKFDPISIRDYYALAGIFRSTEITSHFSEEWKDGRPRALQPLAERSELEKLNNIDHEIELLRRERWGQLSKARENLPKVETSPLPGTVLEFEAENFDGQKDLKTIPLGEGEEDEEGKKGEALATRRRLDQWVRYRIVLPSEGTYTLLVRYAATDPSPVEIEINGKTAEKRVLTEATHGESPEHFRWDAIDLGQQAAERIFLRLKVGRNETFPTLDRFVLIRGKLSPADTAWRKLLGPPTQAETRSFLSGEALAAMEALEASISELRSQRPQLPLALAVYDKDAPMDLPVHPGGNPHAISGDPVPRAVPQFGGVIDATFPIAGKESGRVEFAKWLSTPSHPLTARVIVNRIWHWHFGTGLVRTVDDFGNQGTTPTHPELLDWLASELIHSGWSIKHLQRLILSSATYRASSAQNPDSVAKDPDATLYSRFPTRRLEIEVIYDSMLSSIGKVPRQAPGTVLDTSKSKDRALYILTSSRSPLGLGMEIRKMFPLFGFDDSGRPMHNRDRSVTPAQGLWWLNNPLPRHYATHLAEQLIAEFPGKPVERAQALHETVLGRPASPEAEAAMLSYLHDLDETAGLTEAESWTRLCLGLFSTTSFRTLE